ncbi:heavy metal-associated isoprenylated plant protein 47-like [Arachis stenosperma]|uniref:heavy metal-associated isoprenylated plant protein 47-like n=1 Tax=Arachis stenosperma TaxID=217475 RepID=UPI0025AC566F|nr:heavy metal-associated isoprenylated plant protein 47-like [Arachis stenosperma]
MQQKIVIEVTMENEKWRSKALKIASEEKGVTSVSVNGDNKLEVIGNNVNTVCLAKQLSKKFCPVTILSVEVLKPPKEKEKEKEVAPPPAAPAENPPRRHDDGCGDGNIPFIPGRYYPPCDRMVVVVCDSYNDCYEPGCTIF